MSHKAFHQREIDHLQEQNSRIVAQVEEAEQQRDSALEQIKACEERDAQLTSELQAVKDKINALVSRLQSDKSETIAKDERVRVLLEQNNQMLALLEKEENKAKDSSSQIQSLEVKNRKLQGVAEQFDTAKAELDAQVAEAKSKCADIVAMVRNQRSTNENLRTNIQNTEAKTRVDIEALGQALMVVDQKNLEYMNRIQKQETREKQLTSETSTLKEEIDLVRADIDALRKKLEGDEEGRSQFERQRSQVELQIEALEVQADTLKKALSTAERANEHLQEENKTSADRCRETADKVYALMDSLRLNQVESKKIEAENANKDKKVLSLERQTQNLQAKISMECDAKVLAEQEKQEALQESVLLKKKNKKVEEAVTVAQQAQEKAEREIATQNTNVSELQTRNAYLASRIDTQEEEKNALKAEIKKASDKSGQLVNENTHLRDEIDRLEEEVATVQNELKSYKSELEYIKREDVLDDAGRQRPVLIQSNDSDLVEKLQINEFLYEAQQARNPVPPMIEKVAQLLAMLHEGQERADHYLGDLSKSNGLVSALRQRNMALFTRTQMFESFKTRALLKYVRNLVEDERMTDLHVDGLSFGMREINDLIGLLPRYDSNEKIFVISFQDNGLDDEAINLLLQLIHQLPYLRRIDLKKNCFSSNGIKKFEDQLRLMEGITTVIKSPEGVLNVHSGNQLRLVVDLGEQIPKETLAREVDFTVQQELSHQDADPFLSSTAGASHNPWAQQTQGTFNKTEKAGGGGGGGGGGGATQKGYPTAATQRAPTQAVPDPSSVELTKPSAAPSPAAGGPPVGLGGPGNVAVLSRRAEKKAPPDPKKRQAKRAKAAPPPVLEYDPVAQVVDKWSAPRPHSGLRKSSSARSGDFGVPQQAMPDAAKRSASMDRSSSMPQLPPKSRAPPPPSLPRHRPGPAGGLRPPR